MRDVAPRGAEKNTSEKREKCSSKCAMLFSPSSVIIRRYLFEDEVKDGFSEKVQRFYDIFH